ncbi:MAG: hypothetical protein Q8Q37_03030 [bacterium]|nr:hypothetical protein [bacterium]
MKYKIAAFVIAGVNRPKKGDKIVEAKAAQSAPQYYELPKQFAVSETSLKIGGNDVKFLVRSYAPDILLAETVVETDDVFSQETFKLREELIDACHKILKDRGSRPEMSEEYALAIVYDYQGDPERFLSADKKAAIASFLKSEKMTLAENEIEYTLSKQLKYAKDDLIIVDWDGSFIFDPVGDVESAIDLFQTANLQLLRYRILDSELDNRLKKVARLSSSKTEKKLFFFGQKELANSFQEIIKIRTQSITEFESFERDIKLIGDWYLARLYDLIAKKFKLEEWRSVIRNKFESLEDIYNIVSEKFSLSRNERLEFIQIAVFFVLQLGWFVLIILEFMFYLKATEHL